MGGGSRGKKDAAYSALLRLLEEPGSDHVIMQDLLDSVDPKEGIAAALLGTPKFDDRGVAIVFGALLERALETAISTHFYISADEARRLFSYTDDGPLAEFSAKIAMGYALGIYDNRMQSDLKWIARIRNAFAHARVAVGFDTEAIIGACDQLMWPHKNSPLHTSKGIAKAPRQRFTACIGMMVIFLRKGPSGPRKYVGSVAYQVMYGRAASIARKIATTT